MYKSDESKYQRKASREIVCAKAKIMIDGNWHNCRVLNISTAGAKLRMDLPVDVGMLGLLNVGDYGQFKTTYVWRERDEIGVGFPQSASEMTDAATGLPATGR